MSKLAERLLSDLDTIDIKNKLMEYPELIREQKLKVRNLREVFAEMEEQRAILEADITTTIAAEIDPNTGKARFSNEKARAAELMIRKAADGEYKAADKRAKQAAFNLEDAEDELAMLYDKFKATRYRARLVSSELELLASEDADSVKITERRAMTA